MVTIAVAAAGAVLAKGATGAALFAITAATAATAIGASYLDSKFIYPALFGRDRPQNPNVLGIDQMTGEDGAPGHRSWGRLALVGGHVLWFENLESQNVSQGNKKGTATNSFIRRTADVGIGWTRNLIANVEQINADQKVFWRRDPNNVKWSDFRATITTASAGTRIRIEPTEGDVQDLGPIFTVGNVVRISGMLTTPNGLWRVAAIEGFGGASPFGYVELTPLGSQTPAAGTAGTIGAPMVIVRVDASIVDHLAEVQDVALADSIGILIRTDGPNASSASYYSVPISNLIAPGRRVLIENSTFSQMNGLWDVTQAAAPFATTFNYRYTLRRVNTVAWTPPSAGLFSDPFSASATNPARITLFTEDGFLEPVANQDIQHYLGTEDQGPDVDLLSVYGAGNVHGYRGLARSTVRNLGLSNWGDRVPQFTAAIKIADQQTTHDVIRDLMRESFGDDTRYDLSKLTPNALLGYTRRGKQSTTTTIQPLAIGYGIEAQERGDRWTFFKAEAADLFQIAETELGAYVGQGNRPARSFNHNRLPDSALSRTLSFFYRDPLNDFSRSEKIVRTSRPEDEQNEGVVVDVDPLVLYPWEAQSVANRLFDNAIVARDQGSIVLPPSRADLLVNDRLTFTALNWNEEDIEPVAGAIDYTTQIAGIEPSSIAIEVDFENAGTCRLVDDGAGALGGWPASVTPSTNVIDYAAGTIEFAADDDILQARIRYEFPNGWRMRAQRIVRRVNGTAEVDVVAVAENFPVVGSPVQVNTPSFPAVVRPANLQSHVLDIPAFGGYPEHETVPGIFYAAAALPGNEWRGALVYSSLDGTSYTLRHVLTSESGVGISDGAPLNAGTTTSVVDWSISVNVTVWHGTLTDATIEDVMSSQARNWALIGNEIVAFLRATPLGNGNYTLSGLIRGLRNTEEHMATHVGGERFVLLTGLGAEGFPEENGAFERLTNPGDIGANRWWKIVPAGGVLDDYAAVQVAPQARNIRPFAPVGIVQGDIATYRDSWSPANPTYNPAAWLTQDVVVRWFRRSRSLVAAFGAGSSAPLLEATERYEVRVIRNGSEILGRRTVVGGPDTGSPFVHRTFRYTLAEQAADGWASTDVAVFEVRQIGAGGYSPAASVTWTLP